MPGLLTPYGKAGFLAPHNRKLQMRQLQSYGAHRL